TRRNRIIVSGPGLFSLNTLELATGATWQTLSPQGGSGFVILRTGIYDPVRDRVLLSQDGSAIWELGMAPGASWPQPPVAGAPPGSGPPWLYDAAHDRVVALDEGGGTAPLSISTLSLGDTLRWSGPNTLTPIPPRGGTAVAIDTRRDRLLVFGGGT